MATAAVSSSNPGSTAWYSRPLGVSSTTATTNTVNGGNGVVNGGTMVNEVIVQSTSTSSSTTSTSSSAPINIATANGNGNGNGGVNAAHTGTPVSVVPAQSGTSQPKSVTQTRKPNDNLRFAVAAERYCRQNLVHDPATNASTGACVPLTQFDSLSVPGISITHYIERLLEWTRAEMEIMALAMVYVQRFGDANGPQTVSMHSIHRLLLTAFVVASKYCSDTFYVNKFYAQIGGILLPELNRLELEFLTGIEFSTYITTEDYDDVWQQVNPADPFESSRMGCGNASSCSLGQSSEGDVESRDKSPISPSPMSPSSTVCEQPHNINNNGNNNSGNHSHNSHRQSHSQRTHHHQHTHSTHSTSSTSSGGSSSVESEHDFRRSGEMRGMASLTNGFGSDD